MSERNVEKINLNYNVYSSLDEVVSLYEKNYKEIIIKVIAKIFS